VSSDLDRPFVRSAALLFAALALVLYWPILIGKVPLPAHIVTMFPPWESVPGPERATAPHAEMGDLVTELYPWKVITRRAAARGTLPLWNPYALLGAPFVGDPDSALFYPANLPFLVLPTAIAWSLAFPIRTFLAGLFTALYARSLGARPHAALYAGVAFAFSGWMTAFQPRPHVDAALWLPAVLLAVDRLRERGDGPSAALTAAAFALPVLGGQPECAAHVTLVGLVYFVYRLFWPRRPPEEVGGRAHFAGSFVLAGALALGLASVQILPTLEFIRQLDRSLDASWGHKPLAEIAAFVSRDLGANPNSAGVEIPECAAYAGMLTLLLAPIALRSRNLRDAVFFWALLLVVLGIIYGFGPFYVLSRHVPVLRGIPNWRLLAVADLCLALLAALGLSAICDRSAGRPASAVEWVSAAAVFVAAAAGILWVMEKGRLGFHPHPWISFRTIRGPASSAGVLLAAAVFLALALSGRIRTPVVAVLALAFGAIDLLSAACRFIPFTSPSRIYPPSPTLEFLARDPQPHRVVSIDGASGPGFEQVYGLESPIGFNVVVHRAERVLSIFGFQESRPVFLSERIVASRGRLLDLMNVKYLVTTTTNRGADRLAGNAERFRLVFSDASVRVFENRTVLPRTFLVPASGIEVVRAENAQLARICAADFDPSNSVVLPEPPPPAPFRGESAPILPPGVAGFAQGVNDVRLVASVAEPSVLVLSQTYYPGWRVLVDDRPQPLLRADYAFAGVALAPGRHTVRFTLQPNSLRIGALITGFSLAALVAMCRVRTSR
jgi:Bacterial membrane protein YfhO